MCQKRSTIRIRIRGKVVRVDQCLTNVIALLNMKGLRTRGSCCGHGRYPMSILIDYDDDTVMEIFSCKIIPRKRNFYVTDKDGYYYLPEVSGSRGESVRISPGQ